MLIRFDDAERKTLLEEISNQLNWWQANKEIAAKQYDEIYPILLNSFSILGQQEGINDGFDLCLGTWRVIENALKTGVEWQKINLHERGPDSVNWAYVEQLTCLHIRIRKVIEK